MDVSLQTIALWVVPVVFAITLHEAAHGYVARMFGDRTAEMLGRITLNPLKHIDPVGTILVPGCADPGGETRRSAIRVRLGEAGAGQFRQPARSQARHALGRGGGTRSEFRHGARVGAAVQGVRDDGRRCTSAQWLQMAIIGVSVNLVLMALNLLPIPPLDGGRIAVSLLPLRAAQAWARLEPYGLFIIVGLLVFGVLDDVMEPLLRAGEWLLQAIARTLKRKRATTIALMFPDRVLSGMRPTGRMHIGHYHGALKNWIRLQEEYECLFFAADWHALTTHFDDEPRRSPKASGTCSSTGSPPASIPRASTLFIQSRVPEHAELALLLGMITPVGWLERVPTYKDQQQKLTDRDLSNFGFLGYPVMMSADILVYRANKVPVGEDQVSHIEVTRELARRFNHIYGREPGFEDKARAAVKKLGSKKAKRYEALRTAFQEQGDTQALEAARTLLEDTQNLVARRSGAAVRLSRGLAPR